MNKFATTMVKVPKAIQQNAQMALKVRESKPRSQQGMTEVGLTSARYLAQGEFPYDRLPKLNSYLKRHQVDKSGSTWSQRGKGWQAYYGWGADEALSWSNSLMNKKADSRSLLADLFAYKNTRDGIKKVITEDRHQIYDDLTPGGLAQRRERMADHDRARKVLDKELSDQRSKVYQDNKGTIHRYGQTALAGGLVGGAGLAAGAALAGGATLGLGLGARALYKRYKKRKGEEDQEGRGHHPPHSRSHAIIDGGELYRRYKETEGVANQDGGGIKEAGLRAFVSDISTPVRDPLNKDIMDAARGGIDQVYHDAFKGIKRGDVAGSLKDLRETAFPYEHYEAKQTANHIVDTVSHHSPSIMRRAAAVGALGTAATVGTLGVVGTGVMGGAGLLVGAYQLKKLYNKRRSR